MSRRRSTPVWAAWLLRLPAPVRAVLRRIAYRGSARACPACGRTARTFLPAGRDGARPDALCPWCGSLERHRFVCLFLVREAGIVTPAATVLHFAPERAMARAFRRLGARSVVTLDVEPGKADLAADAAALPFPAAAFGFVYCSHVLEHVLDDASAMAELRRVLAPGGVALIQVPIREGATLEDRTITTPEGRLAAYGQEDHVRFYGDDFPDRLRRAGLEVTVFTPAGLFSAEEIARYGLIPDEPLYRCEAHG